MSIKGPSLTLGARSEHPALFFTCPGCGGHNGVNHFIWRGFAADGPWSTRCADCGYCDRCGKADIPVHEIGELCDLGDGTEAGASP